MSSLTEVKPLPSIKRECLGQLAVALLPIEKLKFKSPRGIAFEREIHDFLVTNFNGYTVSSGNISGHWKDDHGHVHYGEHRQYKVAVTAHEGIASFEVFLSEIAADMREECIYVELGREIFLVYAARASS
jgi:hypothetical protein